MLEPDNLETAYSQPSSNCEPVLRYQPNLFFLLQTVFLYHKPLRCVYNYLLISYIWFGCVGMTECRSEAHL